LHPALGESAILQSVDLHDSCSVQRQPESDRPALLLPQLSLKASPGCRLVMWLRNRMRLHRVELGANRASLPQLDLQKFRMLVLLPMLFQRLLQLPTDFSPFLSATTST